MKHKAFKIIIVACMLASSSIFTALTPSDVSAARPIVFPVIGGASFSNDYDAPRSNGPHHAIDIIAKKHQRIIAAIDGTITFVGYPQPSWGYAIFMKDSSGYSYNYLHINNDTPGTDDGRGGTDNAYAPDIEPGNRVVKGQLLGWVGDSGNAENTVSHLHFEIEDPQGNTVNPYLSLYYAKHLSNHIAHPPLLREILPYGGSSRARVNIAMGNADGDPIDEVVVGVGPGNYQPQIKLYNDNRTLMRAFNAYHNPEYRAGADVAMGDVDGDGVDEIITGTGNTGGPSVKVFTTNGVEIGNFLAYSDSIRTGMSVAAGDIDNDGKDEIITGLRAGATPEVKVFKWTTGGVMTQQSSFMAYQSSFAGGIDVTAADVSGTNAAEIMTIPMSNGGPDVRVYNSSGTQLSQFWAYDTTYRRGSRISAANVRTNTAKAEIITVPIDATSHQKMFNSSGTVLDEDWLVERWWWSTFDVAAGYNDSKGSAGVDRRTSVRPSGF
jgi:hypothetical protein